MSGEGRQRIDKWLWFARVVKTRALAQDLAASGKVRLNARKVDAASQAVKIGDVLTIGLNGRVRVLEIAGFAERRGAFAQARELYRDLTPAAERTPGDDEDGPEDGEAQDPGDAPAPDVPVRPPVSAGPRPVRGEGRPTKRDRRRLDRGPGSGH